MGIAYAKGQILQRSDCVPGTEMGRECRGDTRALAAGLAVLGRAGVCGFHTKSRLILDTASAGCYLFFLSFPVTQGSQFPVQASFQKL